MAERVRHTLYQVSTATALAMEGPVLVGVPVDYRDNHRLMEIVHPEALNWQRQQSIWAKNALA